jgi:hypothetical protein
MTVHSVKMPIGHGGNGIATKGRPLEIMVLLKRCILQVKAESNFGSRLGHSESKSRPIQITNHTAMDISNAPCRSLTQDDRYRPIARWWSTRADAFPGTFQRVQVRCFRRIELRGHISTARGNQRKELTWCMTT